MNQKFKLASNTGSVGIIGGADGPTVVMVSGSGELIFLIPAAIMLIAGTGLAVYAARKGRKGLLGAGIGIDLVGAVLLVIGLMLRRM